jgi:structure-specific recognition protein 1
MTSTNNQPLLFDNISLGGRKATVNGVLTINKQEKVFSWKSHFTGGTEEIRKDKISSLDWMFTTRGYQLRVWKNDANCVEFVGFEEEDYSKLSSFFSDLNIKLNLVSVNAAGTNWGIPTFKGNYLIFKDGEKETFEINLADINNAQKIQKNAELILEFHDDDTASKDDDCLVELRLVAPNAAVTTSNGEELTLESIHKTIIARAEIATDTGEAIASFPNMPFATPRGTYNVDLYRKFLRLHGRTYAFKILYESISTLFLLPKPGGTHMYFVISLDPPVRQGEKRYHHLVLNFAKSDIIKSEEPLVLQLDKKEIEEKFKDKSLKKKMDGPVFEVVAKVFRALTGCKLIGAGKFSSYSSEKAIKCSYKANEGYLFFLEKSIFFLHKPTIYMRHEEIKSFKFQRADHRAGGSRYFDLAILLKNGEKPYVFSNINKNEYEGLVEFIQQKGLVIDNIIQQSAAPNYADGHEDSDEEDEDFTAENEDEEEDDEDFVKYTTKTQAAEEVGEADLEESEKRVEKRKQTESGDGNEPSPKKAKK